MDPAKPEKLETLDKVAVDDDVLAGSNSVCGI